VNEDITLGDGRANHIQCPEISQIVGEADVKKAAGISAGGFLLND
jgi:hypothetical protein